MGSQQVEEPQLRLEWNPALNMFDYNEVPAPTISRHDFFAGMALCGMLTRGIYDLTAVDRAWKIANEMVKHG